MAITTEMNATPKRSRAWLAALLLATLALPATVCFPFIQPLDFHVAGHRVQVIGATPHPETVLPNVWITGRDGYGGWASVLTFARHSFGVYVDWKDDGPGGY